MPPLFPMDRALSLGQALSGRVPLATTQTPLPPAMLPYFQAWKAQYAPNDSGEDYDLQGAFLHGSKPDEATGHWPDTWKKPNHPTFSNQSIYAGLANNNPEFTKGDLNLPGTWNGDQFIPGQDQYKVGNILPIQKNLRTGERSLAIPEALRPLLGLAESANRAAYQGVDPLYDPTMLQQSMTAGFDLGMPALGAGAVAKTAAKEAFDPNALSMFGGQGSETADLGALEQAFKLARKATTTMLGGKRPMAAEDIHNIKNRTGWEPIPGGHWAYEISDEGLKFKPEVFDINNKFADLYEGLKAENPTWGHESLLNVAIANTPKYESPKGAVLGDIIEHPELFQAYPELANIDTVLRLSKSQRPEGIHYPIPNERIRAAAGDTGSALGVLGHEIQHGIQEREGWPSGGNPDDTAQILARLGLSNDPRAPDAMQLYRALMGEVQARVPQQRIEHGFAMGEPPPMGSMYPEWQAGKRVATPRAVLDTPPKLQFDPSYITSVMRKAHLPEGQAAKEDLIQQLYALRARIDKKMATAP